MPGVDDIVFTLPMIYDPVIVLGVALVVLILVARMAWRFVPFVGG